MKSRNFRLKPFLLSNRASGLVLLLVLSASLGLPGTARAAAAPTISAISPTVGSTAGGDSVTITGTNFAGGDTVTIDGNPASSVTVVSATTITALTPAASSANGATVNVAVSDSSGQSATLANSFTYVPSGLSGWWQFNGTANDTSGNGNNGTVNGATLTTDRYANPNGAYNFSSANIVANAGALPAGNSPFTEAAWIKPTDIGTGGGHPNIMSWGNPAGGQSNGLALQYSGGQAQLLHWFYTDDNTWNIANLNDGKWHQVVLVYDGSSLSAYLDGSLLGTQAPPSGPNVAAGSNISMGAVAMSGMSANYFTGGIDDVRVYSRALTQADVTNLYNSVQLSISGVTPSSGSTSGGDTVTITGTDFAAGDTVSVGGNPATNVTAINNTTITATTPASGSTNGTTVDVVVADSSGHSATLASGFTYYGPIPTNGLQAWWPLNGNANDATANHNNGTLSGPTPTVDRFGRTGSAYSFNGSNNYISIPNAFGTGSYSVSSWVKFNGVSGTQVLFFKGSDCPSYGWGVESYLSGGKFNAAVVTTSSGARQYTATGTAVVQTGVWYNVVTVFDNSAQTVTLYVNNKLVASVATGATLRSANNSYIGSSCSSSPSNFVNGSIDDVRLYSTALTASDVTALYYADGDATLPTISSIAPASGSAMGGDSVTITGTNFENGATVTIGGNAATNVMVANSTTITATVPAGTAGSNADVVVANPSGPTATLNGGYYYKYPPPTVTSLSLTSGDVSGGDRVTITGTNYHSGDTVMFGGNTTTALTILSTTSIAVTVPPATGAGAVDVTVTDDEGRSATLTGGYTYTSGQPITDTWVGGDTTKPTDWWTATNWSRGKVPDANSDVVIDGGTNQPTLTMTGPYSVHSLTIGENNASTLTVTGGSTSNTFTFVTDLSIGGHGVVTHSANTTAQTNSLVLDAGGSATIAAGGSINLSGKGYTQGNGPGATKGSRAGSSYGGVGNGGGPAYGSLTEPVDLGSGGYYDTFWGGGGGAGGGDLKLNVGGNLTLNGTIAANGNNGTGGGTYPSGGGGSGGSIWLSATAFAGTGSANANGGSAYYHGGGGGAGGRVALYYSSTSFTGALSAGAGSGGAGAGTIYQKLAGQANGSLTVSGGTNGTYATPLLDTDTHFGTLTVSNGALLSVNAGNTLTADTINAGAGTGANQLGYIQIDGTVNAPTVSVLTNLSIQLNGALTVANATTLSGTALHLNGTYSDENPIVASGGTVELQNTNPSTPWNIQTLTVNSGGTVTSPTNTTAATYFVNIHASGDISIASGGSVDVTGKGYSGNNGPGGAISGGGSYGGVGAGKSTSDAYGSIAQPTDLGSGANSALPGSGGGAIKLVSDGTLTVSGTISANGNGGSASSYPPYRGSAGSGGSIWLSGNTITGGGSVSASGIGGDSYYGTSSGGGGRVALYYTTDTFSGSIKAFGGGSGRVGGAGTIYTKAVSQTYGNLLVDNNGVGTSAFTPEMVADAHYDSLQVTKGAYYHINNGQTVTADIVVAAAGTGGQSGTIQDDGTLNTNSAVLTNYFVFMNGAFNDSSLTIGSGSTVELDNTTPASAWSGAGNLTVASGGKITVPTNTTSIAHSINISVAGTLRVAAGGSVIADGDGYSAANGPGAGTAGAGGTYGGVGGNSTSTVYGLQTEPVDAGSGGAGGAGGGAVKLSAVAGMVVDGTVSANGNSSNAGAGAGGSIWLTAPGITGNGTVSANGGNGSGKGGGGGGRIAFSITTPVGITAVTPASGTAAGGDSVTISGTGLTSTTLVSFGANAAGATYQNSTTLLATTPASTKLGPTDVTVKNVYFTGTVSVSGGSGTAAGADGTKYPDDPGSSSAVLAGGFTYVAPAPAISGITPRYVSTAGGSQVDITGTNFYEGVGVQIDGVAATNVTYVSGTEVRATVPAHAAGSATVLLTNTDGQAASQQLTYDAPPNVTAITPNSGSILGGDTVTVTGTGFVSGASVSFGGTAAPQVDYVNERTLVVTTPAHALGVVDVTVTNPDNLTNTFLASFTFNKPPPTVTSFTPQAGRIQGGDIVTFTGSGFNSSMVASFGGSVATTLSATSTSLRVKIPPGSLGDVSVTISASQTQTATAPGTFRYEPDVYVFTSTPLAVHAGEPGQMVVEARDAGGNTLVLPFDLTLSLTSTSGGGSFSPDASNWGMTSVTIPSGQSSATFYYKDVNSGKPTITAAGPAGTAAVQTENITSKYKLLVTGVSDPIDAGTPSSVTVQAIDWQGSPDPDYTGTVHFTADDSFASLPSDFTITSAMRGHYTFVNGVTMVTSGEHCVSATDATDPNISGSQCDITVQNGYSGAASKLAIITDQQSAEVGAPTSAITVQVQDKDGNPAPVPVDTTVYIGSSAGSGSFSVNGVSGWSSTQPFMLTIKANTSSANLFYKDSAGGTKTLSFRDQAGATDTGLTDTSQSVYIGVGPPAKLGISAAGSARYGSWYPVSVRLYDTNGQPATNTGDPQPIYLTSDNPNITFSLKSDGSNPVRNIEEDIPVGGNQAVFYVYSPDNETVNITASDASPPDGTKGLADDYHAMSFVAPNPSVLSLSTASTTSAGQAVPVTITVFNKLGQQAAPTSNTTISLSDTYGGGSFSLASSPWNPVGSATLPAGSSTLTVYYKTTAARVVTLRASANFASTVSGQTSLSVTPGAYTQLFFSAAPSTVAVSEASSYSVSTEDMYGNVVPMGSDTNVYMYTTSGSGSFASDSTGPWTASSATIPAGSSTATFYYRDTSLGNTGTLTVSDQTPLDSPDSGITNATAGFTVVGQTAARLAFTTSPQTIGAGNASGIITVQAQKADGSPAVQGVPTTVNLSSDSTGSAGFTATSNPNDTPITKVTIPAGGSSVSFYYHDTRAGTHTIFANGAGRTGTQPVTITPGYSTDIVFVTPPRSGQANQPSSQMEVALADMYGNAVNAGFDTPLNLSTDCVDGTFSLSSTAWSPVSSVTISSGTANAYFYFKSALPSCNITVSGSELTSATQTYTTRGGPTQLALAGVPADLEAGEAATITLNLEDADGNLTPAFADTTLYVFATSGSAGNGYVTIPAGSASASFTYTAGADGTVTLQARDEPTVSAPDTGLIDTAATIAVTKGVPAQLTLLPSSDSATVNTSKQLSVHLTNAYGYDTPVGADTPVTLSTTESGGVFTATSDVGGTPITGVTIPAGQSSVAFYYHQTAADDATITASATGINSATSTLTFIPGNLVSYRFVTASTAGQAGQPLGYSLQGLDSLGNVVTLPRGLHIYLRTTGTGSFSAAGWNNLLHAIIVPAATTVVGFTYTTTSVGTDTLTVSDTYPPDNPDTGITNAATTVVITQGPVSKLVFLTPGPSFDRGGVSDPIVVESQNAYGIETPVSADTPIDLLSSSPTGQFALSNSGPWGITQVLMPTGASRTTMYYRDNTNTGPRTITASSAGITKAVQGANVNYGAPATLSFTSPPQTLLALHVSTAYTLTVLNSFGQPTQMPTDTSVNLTTTSTSGQFAITVPSWGITKVDWPAGAASISFYYRDIALGTATITASSSSLSPAAQQVTIIPQVFDHFLVTNISDPQEAGTPSSIVVIAQDSGGYAVQSYAGTIHFTSTDPLATLPPNYTFQPYTDKGIHTFVNGAIFQTSGEQTVTATDVNTGQSGQQTAITVIGGKESNPPPGGTTGGDNGGETTPAEPGTGINGGTGDNNTGGSGNGSQGSTNNGGTTGNNSQEQSNQSRQSGSGFARTLSDTVAHLKDFTRRIVSSPTAPYVLPSIFYALLLGIAVLLLWDMYREIRSADILLGILKRERQTANDKTQFLNLVSHHVRTPVTIIAGAAELLLGTLKNDPQAQQLGAVSKRLQLAANNVVQRIANEAVPTTETDDLAARLSQRRLYSSPMFWAPVALSIGLTVLANILISSLGNQHVHAGAYLFQIAGAVVAALVFYSALRGRTLRKRRKEAFEAALQHRQQLDDAKNSFIGSLGNELRASASELAVLDAKLQASQPALTKPLHNGTQQLLKLIDSVDTLSSIETTEAHTEQFHFEDTLMQVLKARKAEMDAKHLKVEAAGDASELLQQDSGLLQRVIDSLVDNAIAYSPEGGSVRLEAETVVNGQVLKITDNGPGLPKEVTDQLLKPFTHPENTYNESHQGLGLSLYLDTLIMRHLGGSLSVAGTSKNGTTIALQIPSTPV